MRKSFKTRCSGERKDKMEVKKTDAGAPGGSIKLDHAEVPMDFRPLSDDEIQSVSKLVGDSFPHEQLVACVRHVERMLAEQICRDKCLALGFPDLEAYQAHQDTLEASRALARQQIDATRRFYLRRLASEKLGAAILLALYDDANHGVVRMDYLGSKHFAYFFEGDEVVFSPEDRASVERAIWDILIEKPCKMPRAATVLTFPERIRPFIKETLDAIGG